MTDFAQDREIERLRYNQRAGLLLNSNLAEPGPDGAESVDIVLRRPYLVYENLIKSTVRPGFTVLDICCGDGVHSLTAARLGAVVTACDIAENNLLVAQRRAQRAGVSLLTVTANAEALPFSSHCFDLVTCAGSLSYVGLAVFLGELRRVLRPGGVFIFIDSFDHNPLYRLNRYRRYLCGQRSRSTLERIPTLATLETIRGDFPGLTVSYHGVFNFLVPVLRIFGRARVAAWLESCDVRLPALRHFAFNIVGIGHRPSVSVCSATW